MIMILQWMHAMDWQNITKTEDSQVIAWIQDKAAEAFEMTEADVKQEFEKDKKELCSALAEHVDTSYEVALLSVIAAAYGDKASRRYLFEELGWSGKLKQNTLSMQTNGEAVKEIASLIQQRREKARSQWTGFDKTTAFKTYTWPKTTSIATHSIVGADVAPLQTTQSAEATPQSNKRPPDSPRHGELQPKFPYDPSAVRHTLKT